MSNTIPLSNPVGTSIYVNLTSNATGSQVKTSSIAIFQVDIDNSAGSIDVFTKLYNVSSAPTVGTTVPDAVIRTTAGRRQSVMFGQGEGITYATGLFEATVTQGGTGGTTAPTTAVIVRIEKT